MVAGHFVRCRRSGVHHHVGRHPLRVGNIHHAHGRNSERGKGQAADQQDGTRTDEGTAKLHCGIIA